MDDSGSGGSSWSDVLMQGVSGFIDSQVAKNYAISNPQYNTAGGVAGTNQTPAAVAASPVVWIVLALAAALVVFLVVTKR
jgi:hypothetical protein